MAQVQRQEPERVVIELKNRMAVIVLQPFDGDIDTESLFKIDYSNILGEILTFPVLFNRIANLKAEMANILAHQKLDFEIFEANLYKQKRSKLEATGQGGSRGPSIKDVEMEVVTDPTYKIKKGALIDVQKNFDHLDALYWSAQSKDTKLRSLSDRIRPDEFEGDIVEGTVNGILVKLVKKSIQ